MKVVSNTSPILNLARIGELSLLQLLFDRVIAPDAVLSELESQLGKDGLGSFSTPAWIERRTVANKPLVESLRLELDSGEAEAIALAVEIHADIVLLDERVARKVGRKLGLGFTGVLGVLVEAKRQGLIPLVKPLLDALLTRAGFWVGRSLYARVLSEAGE